MSKYKILLEDGSNLVVTHKFLGLLALSLVDESCPLYTYFKVSNDIWNAFGWRKTPQGDVFWHEVSRGIGLDEKEKEAKKNFLKINKNS